MKVVVINAPLRGLLGFGWSILCSALKGLVRSLQNIVYKSK